MRLIESRPAVKTDLNGVAHQVPLANAARQRVSDNCEADASAGYERQRGEGIQVFACQRAIAIAAELRLNGPEGPLVRLRNEVYAFIKLREAELCADLLRHFRQEPNMLQLRL